jgi:hypothetical protein
MLPHGADRSTLHEMRRRAPLAVCCCCCFLSSHPPIVPCRCSSSSLLLSGPAGSETSSKMVPSDQLRPLAIPSLCCIDRRCSAAYPRDPRKPLLAFHSPRYVGTRNPWSRPVVGRQSLPGSNKRQRPRCSGFSGTATGVAVSKTVRRRDHICGNPIWNGCVDEHEI